MHAFGFLASMVRLPSDLPFEANRNMNWAIKTGALGEHGEWLLFRSVSAEASLDLSLLPPD